MPATCSASPPWSRGLHVEAYAETVARLSLKRRLITAGNRIMSIGYDRTKEADEALDDAEKALYEVSQRPRQPWLRLHRRDPGRVPGPPRLYP